MLKTWKIEEKSKMNQKCKRKRDQFEEIIAGNSSSLPNPKDQ